MLISQQPRNIQKLSQKREMEHSKLVTLLPWMPLFLYIPTGFPSFSFLFLLFFAVVKDLGLPCGFEVYNKERKLYHIILDWFFNLGPTICLQLDVAFLANQAWSFDSLTNIRPQRGGSLVMVSLILHFLLIWF